MFKSVRFANDGLEESISKSSTFRKCLKPTLTCVFLVALSLSIIYHGIVFERMARLKEILALNKGNYAPLTEPTGSDPSELIDVNAPIINIDKALQNENEQLVTTHRRLIRSLDDLDPSILARHEPSLQNMYNNVRSKRTKFMLLKLEDEYLRCKKAAVSSKDCMLVFMKMYNIAKDFSSKMEELKDSLKEHKESKESSHSSIGSNEKFIHDVKNFTAITANKTMENSTLAPITEAFPPFNESPNSNLPIKSKIKLSKISWIIDGHDDYEDENYEETDVNNSTSTSARPPTFDPGHGNFTTGFNKILENSTTKMTTEGIFELIKTKSTTSNPSTLDDDGADEKSSIYSDFTNIETTTTPESILENSTGKGSSDDEFEISSFVNTETDFSTSTEGIENDQAILRKMKFDWIIDGDESSDEDYDTEGTKVANSNSTTSSPTPIVMYPTKPETMKISWIIDSGDPSAEVLSEPQTPSSTAKITSSPFTTTGKPNANKMDPKLHKTMTANNSSEIEKIKYSGDCKYINAQLGKKLSDCSLQKENDHSKETQVLTSHPLDDPTSYENMIDSEERNNHEIQKIMEEEQSQLLNAPVLVGESLHVTGKNATVNQLMSTTVNPYDRKEWVKNFEEAAAQSSQNELMNTFGEVNMETLVKFGPKLNPANLNNFGDAQFMSICERMAQKLRNKGVSGNSPGSMSENHTENFTQQPNLQFTSRGPGGFPVTGETMKASAQFMFNPTFGVPSFPICFYVTPANMRLMNPMWAPSYFGMPGNYAGGNTLMGGSVGGLGGPGGIFFVPQNIGPTGQFFGNTGGSTGGAQSNLPNIFSKNASPQKQQQFFCTYMQSQNNNQNQVSGPGGFSNANFKMRAHNQTANGDIIYASYAGLPTHLGHEEHFKCRLPNQVACYGGNECIAQSSWCDGTVDCSDGSDEGACTCRDRLLESRVCDGFADCPMGEDEVGCFGCGDFMHSCYESPEEFGRNNRSTVSMCYTNLEKCDGFVTCLNGRDEKECSLIVNDITHHMSHSVSTSEGFLYRNFKGEWLPVCNNGEKWAKEACEMEGATDSNPILSYKALTLPGPFIEPSLHGTIQLTQTCQKRDNEESLVDHISYVKCSPPKCGMVKENLNINKRYKRSLRSLRHKRVKRNVQNGRIVGGYYAKPLQWPFVVAMFRNGNFHCGGTIYSEHWVISAAHCVINFHKYYYEVRAGVLRRTSFSVSTQIRPISHVVVHQGYERRSMRNDLSLLKVEEPFTFNRWVKPICLPDQGRTTNGDDWIWGPVEDTICTAVGWGAVREKGPGSDNLRQVDVPIIKLCKEMEDRESENICAGDAGGGRDACQGDSGGPLFCRSVGNSNQWYLAGVISHGNGCARPSEFGVYTRVALYLDWIEMATLPEYLPKIQPQQMCSGYMCVWGGKRCIPQRKRCDRIVDCLGGEDEVGCVYNFIPDLASVRNVSTTESDYHPVEETTSASFHKKDENAATLKDMLLSQTIESNTLEVVSVSATDPPNNKNDSNHETQIEKKLPTDFESSTENEKSTTEENFKVPTPEEDFEKFHDLIVTFMQTLQPGESFSKTDESTKSPIQTQMTTIKDPIEDNSFKNADTTSKYFDSSTYEFTTGNIPDIKSTTKLVDITIKNIEDTSTTDPTTTTATSVTLKSVTNITNGPEKITKETFATEKSTITTSAPKVQPLKFTCTKMTQIIDQKHRCDRIFDCEDGTDEDNCTCRDYLKAPLDILICDGKTDCEDITDEENCGNCSEDEFLCPLSKNCIPMSQRCDDKTDCKFKEDEKDCFALSNGKAITLDLDGKPTFTNEGVFSRNRNGVWNVVCAHETNFFTQSATTAQDICFLLGFKGFKYYNTTDLITNGHIVPIEPDLRQERLSSDHLHADAIDRSVHFMQSKHFTLPASQFKQRTIPMQFNQKECFGMYVDCHAVSNKEIPIKTLSASEPMKTKPTEVKKINPILETHNKPNVFVHPETQTMMVEKKEEILEKLDAAKHLKGNITVLVKNQLHKAIEEIHWPWLVDIYTNGKLWCLGILIDKHWIVVHSSCLFGMRLTTDYVAALLGGGKSKEILHKSPHEQIRRIDCAEPVPNSDVILLHLEMQAKYSHHILPSYIPEKLNPDKIASDECIAILHDNVFGRPKTVSILGNPSDISCNGLDILCLQFKEQQPPINLLQKTNLSIEELVSVSEEIQLNMGDESKNSSTFSMFTSCKQFGSKAFETIQPVDQGVLVCKDVENTWYPKAMFEFNNTNCLSFNESFKVRTMDKALKAIKSIIGKQKCTLPHSPPQCLTWRCPLGECLEKYQVCNGNPDCHDGSDEYSSMCKEFKKECNPWEMRCRSNDECVPKEKFCDHVSDCKDFSDEPTICSCFTFLRATDPSKICDGVRNCWDKSDESPAICNCTENHFQCGSSMECVPRDFVCDKSPDCPNGEDEKFCFGIEHPIEPHKKFNLNSKKPLSKRPLKFGQVIEQSYGLWHTKCFPKSSPPDISEVRQICLKLGYNPYRQPSYRLIDDLDNEVVETFESPDQKGRSFGSADLVGKYRPSTKAIVANKFSPLHINDNLHLYLKPSRPIAELVHWNSTDSKNCFRLEIKCA